jgi:hypothetical protein
LEDSCCDPLRYLVVIFMVHCLRSCYWHQYWWFNVVTVTGLLHLFGKICKQWRAEGAAMFSFLSQGVCR